MESEGLKSKTPNLKQENHVKGNQDDHREHKKKKKKDKEKERHKVF